MSSWLGGLVLWFRMLVVLGFLALMPVLALPAVGRLADTCLYPAKQGAKHGVRDVTAARNPHIVAGQSLTVGDETDRRSILVFEWQQTDAGEAGGRMEAIEGRLRGLGASRLLLERLASEGQPYHCWCVMRVPGSPLEQRAFGATGPDAVEAMERVLAEVERWSGGAAGLRSALPAALR